jgi:Gpi18-like mannosyltransferase
MMSFLVTKVSKVNKLLLLILLIGFLVRLYRIDFPLADWHSWRQADTAAVSKIFVDQGINVLYPKYFDISNIQTGQENPNGYRFVEFPLYNVVHSILAMIFPIFSLEIWGRLVTIIASVVAGYTIFLLVRNKYDEVTGVLSSAIYSQYFMEELYCRILPW